ncbi:hypothetical protein GJR96_00605 [Haloferax sp. MBLA0076]|uniref:Uncharacterized protein n=1 Tax=Haloferax litoreum TaxID=2666140 RepID=A0A6A8GCE7_9EURY|nr:MULTISPECIES: hypothetical protein [Haloferax]KAB1192017.1 hypothetical protein Hfx1148_00605 [Haloferax sp. CBA1148]MRX20459.1 hypothetical protein [Haloferax litoreum]
MSEYTERKEDELKRPWIVKDGDGEHTLDDAPTWVPERASPISQQEADDMGVLEDDGLLALFYHKENHDLLLWLWKSDSGIVIEFESEPGYSLPYWVPERATRDAITIFVESSEWKLSDVPDQVREELIDGLVEWSETK